jgi:hypothetical protein
MNDEDALPASFPAAWRLPRIPGSGGNRARLPPRAVAPLPSLEGLRRAFQSLTEATADQSTALVSERIQSLPWLRTIGQTPADARPMQFSQRFLVPCAAQTRDDRPLNPLAMSVIEFAMHVRACSLHSLMDLGRVSLELDDADDGRAHATYESLAKVPGLIEAMRGGAAVNDVAKVLAAAAAAAVHRAPSSQTERQENVRLLVRRIARRVAVAGRALHASRRAAACTTAHPFARIERPAWAVLFESATAGFEAGENGGNCGGTEGGEGASVTALIALGPLVPLMPVSTPAAAETTTRRFLLTMEELIAPKWQTWTLSDALIPCNAVPIRTNHYVAYLQSVASYATRVAHALLCEERGGDLAPTREQSCAWALAALASDEAVFGSVDVFRAWIHARAHEPPALGRVVWIVARALLGQQGLDVDALASALQPYCTRERAVGFGACCIATRTPLGIQLLIRESERVESGAEPQPSNFTAFTSALLGTGRDDGSWRPIDCLSCSPSGTMEFGVYETGWSEWATEPGSRGDASSTHDTYRSTNVAIVVRHEMSRVLRGLAESAERAASEAGRRALWSITRLSLVPDNLLGRHWKYAIEEIQEPLERALSMSCDGGATGRLPSTLDAAAEPRTTTTSTENALNAAIFRRRCLRALNDASRHNPSNAALATWLSDESGAVAVFARSFPGRASAGVEAAVIEYERLLRVALVRFARSQLSPTPSVVHKTSRGMRVARLGVDRVAYLDDASANALSIGTPRLAECCSSNAVLNVASCAVSVVRWSEEHPKS